jgi:hypothetical protein
MSNTTTNATEACYAEIGNFGSAGLKECFKSANITYPSTSLIESCLAAANITTECSNCLTTLVSDFKDCFADKCGQKNKRDNKGKRKGQAKCLQCVAKIMKDYKLEDSASDSGDEKDGRGWKETGNRPRDDTNSTNTTDPTNSNSTDVAPSMTFSVCGLNSSNLPSTFIQRLDAPFDGSPASSTNSNDTSNGSNSNSVIAGHTSRLATAIIVISVLAAYL